MVTFHCLLPSLLLLTAPSVSSAFIFPSQKFVQNPDLLKHVDSQAGSLFNIRLDIGVDDDSPHFHATGLLLELERSAVDPNKVHRHPRLPGAHGPHSELSSGCFPVRVVKHGTYIDMNGQQPVILENGVWEMNWREGAPAGSIVCGFGVPHKHSRNNASLGPGNLYITFPVFTKEGLREAQAEKQKIMDRAQALLDESEEHYQKMNDTTNPLMKALHFRNAYAIKERHMLTMDNEQQRLVKMIPQDKDVVRIADNLYVTNKGTVWSKEKGMMIGPDRHFLLGTAFLMNTVEGGSSTDGSGSLLLP